MRTLCERYANGMHFAYSFHRNALLFATVILVFRNRRAITIAIAIAIALRDESLIIIGELYNSTIQKIVERDEISRSTRTKLPEI